MKQGKVAENAEKYQQNKILDFGKPCGQLLCGFVDSLWIIVDNCVGKSGFCG